MSPQRGGNLRRSRSPRQRVGNTTFYVVAEGQGTEYDYLSRLNQAYGSTNKFMIRTPRHNAQPHGLPPLRVIDHASGIVGQHEFDQVWGLFDHDGRSDIDSACSRGQSNGVKVALSHPAFELWLLLHFQDFTPACGGHSKMIIEKLRAAHSAFDTYGKRDKRIDERRFAALVDDHRIDDAVRRARALSKHCEGTMPSKRDPSTDVYLLIEALGIT